MSFIFKQMLNNITTTTENNSVDISALQDEVNQLILKNIYYGFRVCGTTYQNCNSGNTLIFDNKTRTDYGCHVLRPIN